MLQLWKAASKFLNFDELLEYIREDLNFEFSMDEVHYLQLDTSKKSLHLRSPVRTFIFDDGEFHHFLTKAFENKISLELEVASLTPKFHQFIKELSKSFTHCLFISESQSPMGCAFFRSRALNENEMSFVKEFFTTAIRNHFNLENLKMARNSAESDKLALLNRIGRDSITQPMIGADTGLKHVSERIKIIAPTDVPVLLLGETGTGKEVAARALHDQSIRKNKPFIRVNCGAISPGLIDSELFGHEKGSFTGASNLRKGWFERADGGTLFLDEIGEMPESVQVRLLRVLQDGSFERVGGNHVVHVDVRVIAATHQPLNELVATGRFRKDLWYRIATFPIDLPALRDRPEDIPGLCQYFIQRASKRFGLPSPSLSNEDIQTLISYSWPGNIRELSSIIDRAMLLGQGKRLDFRTAIGMHPSSPQKSESDSSDIDSLVKNRIEEALHSSRGRIEGPFGAAKALNMNHNTLRSKMRKLGINNKVFRDA